MESRSDGARPMPKSQPFTIHLLKAGFDPSNALKQDHKLKDSLQASSLPTGASLFVLDAEPTQPWWKQFFGVEGTLKQMRKGALLFTPVTGRVFVFSFGNVHHELRDDVYEYDFGLRVTLNCIDPKKLKSTDTLDPGRARRQRTQVPAGTDLTYFDFDHDSSLLKSLTGKVSKEYEHLFKHVNGAASVSLRSKSSPQELVALCGELLALYESESYKKDFPNIQNVVPVLDPTIVDKLNEKLLEAVSESSDHLYLAAPEIVDYSDGAQSASFSGLGRSLTYDDVYLDSYYHYLAAHGKLLKELTIEDLRKHRLNLTNEEGDTRKPFAVFNCLIFDVKIGFETTDTYHLAEGKWYRVDGVYVAKLSSFLDSKCSDSLLPDYKHLSEGEYNRAVAKEVTDYICLDETDISPNGHSQVEPCDLYRVEDEVGSFIHVKRSTTSSQLSHLFNQGVNAIQLLRSEPESVEKLKQLVEARANSGTKAAFMSSINAGKFQVLFGIVTHKSASIKSENLPLFSKISLTRSLKALQFAGIPCQYFFIPDLSPKKGAKEKVKASTKVAFQKEVSVSKAA